MKSKLLALVALIALSTAGLVAAAALTDTVKLHSGAISGEALDDGIRVFRGIPFAAPPVGELRWQPPRDVTAWDSVRQATKFGNACPQPPVLLQMDGPNAPELSEDCLFLNVWTPARSADDGLAVMVWIHGGGLSMGHAAQGVYDGTGFAKKGVILVSVNYRLGPLGYLAHPALSAESKKGISGNYGFLDQVASLEWVQQNIAAFGGDPGNVTIFGESAGGTSIFALLATPVTKDLFHRAIAESPWITETNVADQTRKTPFVESAEDQGVEWAKLVAGEGASLADLRALDANEMIEKGGFSPIINVDGRFLPKMPEAIFAAGEQQDVPMIVGTNANEGTMFMGEFITSLEAYTAALQGTYGDGVDTVLGLYPAKDKADLPVSADRYITDAWFLRGARSMLRGHGNVSSPAFQYHFTKKSRAIPAWGAHHAAELGFVFNTFQGFGPASEPDESELALGGAMIDYWSQFAKTGDPNVEGRPAWPAFETATEKHLELGNEIKVGAKLQKDNCDTLDKVIATAGR